MASTEIDGFSPEVCDAAKRQLKRWWRLSLRLAIVALPFCRHAAAETSSEMWGAIVRTTLAFGLLILGLLTTASMTADAADWSHWRGPNRNGTLICLAVGEE